MPKKSFTAQWVENVTCTDSRVDYFDQKLPGLGLRVSPSGVKSWFYMYRPKGSPRKARMTLGRYPVFSLADVRDTVREKSLMVARGSDPAEEQREKGLTPTFADLADAFIDLYAKEHKRSWREDQRVVRKELLPAWANRKAQDITRRDVIALLDKIVKRGARIQANRTLALIRKMYNWGIGRDLVSSNPCVQIPAPGKETQRDRVLTEPEIRALWAAFGKQSPLIAAMLKLRLVTAQRGGEVCSMAWADIDLENSWWLIPAERAKNGLAHRVPLSDFAVSILAPLQESRGESEWVFPSPVRNAGYIANVQKAAQRVKTESGVDDFVLHDLRRTAASYMTSLGVSRLVVSKILNHVEPGVTRVYDRYSYDQEKRQALDIWSTHLSETVVGDRQKQRSRAEHAPS